MRDAHLSEETKNGYRGPVDLVRSSLRSAYEQLWRRDLRSQPAWRAALIRSARILAVVSRDLADGQISLRAMSLVYTTLLSIVPLLAVSFSVLKAFGVQSQIETTLANFLAPLGDQGVEITERIVSFVANVSSGVLGTLGLLFLFYTVVSLLQKIESAFNAIWKVDATRPLARRFSDYITVVLIGPVLIFSALGLMASLMNTSFVESVRAIQPFGFLVSTLAKTTPYILVISAFTFIYVFVPNTRVRFASALFGGVIAGILWNLTGWAFASFVVTSARYAAIYSALASLVLFMIWLYAGWLIMLVGSKVAFYFQHPEYVTPSKALAHLNIAEREKLALHVALLIAERFDIGVSPWTSQELAAKLEVPRESVDQALTAFFESGLMIATESAPIGVLPARPLQKIHLFQLVDAVRGADSEGHPGAAMTLVDQRIQKISQAMRTARRNELGDATLNDLISQKAGATAVSFKA
jgi:membrane protein